MARIAAAAIAVGAQRGVRRRNANLLRTACGMRINGRCVPVVAAAETAI